MLTEASLAKRADGALNLDNDPHQVGSLSFDKDDDDALSFVTAASNLRAKIFGIELQARTFPRRTSK